MRRLLVVAVGTAAFLTTPSGAVSPAQVVDPAGDANGGTYWAGDPDTVTPAGSQAYADVTGVRFVTTKATKRVGRRTVTTVTGFSVTMALSAAPVPPGDATGIYRVFAMGPRCVVGIEHYTRPLPDVAQPRTALFDTCRGSLRRTAIPPATVKGGALAWHVPLTAVPKDTRVGVGTTLSDLHFEVYVSHQATCAGTSPGAEQPPCALLLDTTLKRNASFVIR